MSPIVTLTIPGRVGILKNSKRVIARGRGRRAIVLPSLRYSDWERHAARELSKRLTVALIDVPVEAHFRFFFKNHQGESDLSNMLGGPEDVLQRVGVIANDRLIYRIEAEKFFGHDPRTEIEIYKYEPQPKETT